MLVSRAFPEDLHDASAGAADDQLRSAAARTFARFEAIDRRVVERAVSHARRLDLLGAARVITRAGNGWIYPVISLILLASGFDSAVRCLTTAASSLAIAFLIYPPLKRWFARTRPCHRDLNLADMLPPLDRYSFPSGHAMTAAAFSLPLIIAAPAAAAPIVIACALVSWSRIALGHHYPTDIVGGVIVGGAIAAIVSAALL